MPQTRRALSPREEKFIDVYFATSNLTRAYREAFGVDSRAKAIKLLRMPAIEKRLAKIRQQAKEVIQISSADVLARLDAMSSATVFDILDRDTGKLREDIDRDTALMVKSIKVMRKQTEYGEDETIQISLNDRTRVLELLGKSINMFKENIDLNVTVSLRDQIKSDAVSDNDVAKLLESFRNMREEPEEMISVEAIEVDDG